MSESASSAPVRTPWPRAAALAVGLSVAVGVILLAFSWPAVTAAPHDIPVGIVGPEAAVGQLQDAVGGAAGGAVAFTRYDDRAAATAAIEARRSYGAIVLGATPAQPPEVLTATAASPQVAQLMDGIAQQLQARVAAQAPGATVKVTDVVPFADSDSRGTGLTVAILPLVIGGMLGGVILSLLVVGAARRLVGLVVYAVAVGLVLTGVLQGLYGVLLGSFWLNAAAIGLAVAAIAAAVTGLASLIGRPGAALGVVLVLLVGTPLSGAMAPVEFIVAPWGAVGQWMPPGAAATLVRDLSYFPAAGAAFPWLVLSAWALVGAALTLLGRRGRDVSRPALG